MIDITNEQLYTGPVVKSTTVIAIANSVTNDNSNTDLLYFHPFWLI